ncbi:MAG: hypothetical protein ACJ8GL_05415 [Bacillus sp. (in: firmicutes)]
MKKVIGIVLVAALVLGGLSFASKKELADPGGGGLKKVSYDPGGGGLSSKKVVAYNPGGGGL